MPIYLQYFDEDIWNVFRQFDTDNSGYLTVKELKQALARYGYSFTDGEISKFVASIDLNNDGRLNFQGRNIYLKKRKPYIKKLFNLRYF